MSCGPSAPRLARPSLTAAMARDITDDLQRLADRNRGLCLWWRDDDAVAPSDDLDRLLRLGDRLGVPIAVAAVPGFASPALARRLAQARDVRVLVHGWRHQDHEPTGAKSSEFGPARTGRDGAVDAGQALARAAELFGDGLLPVLVPPWNRIAPAFPPELAVLGYGGLSCFGAPAQRRPGLLRIDTHFDPIAWRSDRDLVEPDAFRAQWRRALLSALDDPAPPIVGLLSHHRVTTEKVWAFVEELVGTLVQHRAVVVPPLAKLWSPGPNQIGDDPMGCQTSWRMSRDEE